ncbi:phospholipase [Streptomyces sp. P38-E01]|uniref:Phospholipase n=1 Tax=Streptomyces tardus TaxID=2780544 RepID=A0A949JFG4_9ACTN|nr:phospholipase A2 [Streptomyces tardus]MBU7597524.1 phospholipase [Streptomyces tardus]
MRRTLRTTVAAVAVTASAALGGGLLTAAPAAAAPLAEETAASSQSSARSNLSVARGYMNLSHTQFAGLKKVKPFNWTNNGCSVPTGYAPYMKTFTTSCNQHDFGYRNFGSAAKGLELDPTRTAKNWIDARFKAEMRRACKTKYKKGNPLKLCNSAAAAYHFAVNNAGDKHFFG